MAGENKMQDWYVSLYGQYFTLNSFVAYHMPFFKMGRQFVSLLFLLLFDKGQNPFRGEVRLIPSRCYGILNHVNV